MLLNILQCLDPITENYPAHVSMVLRLRNPGIEFFFFNLNFKKCFSVNLDFSFLVSFHDREVPVHLYI